MIKIAVLFSNGTEEIEALTPVDVLRRAGVDCDIVSVSGEYPKGSHNITVKADKLIENIDIKNYDGIVIPGGMPGATIISENPYAMRTVKGAINDKKLVAAICASPAVVLANNRLIDGKIATCYPADAFIEMMGVCDYTGADVQTDGNLITANGPKSAMKFALAVCDYLGAKPKF
ncbi:MAG: DJ-1/PfpI family protein [Clostridia bacterium]|nr:DJ-1/PfpI family protein [Clostridia bacterium]